MTSEFAHLDSFLMPQSDEMQDMPLICPENELSYEVDQSSLSSVGYQEKVIRKSKTVPNKVPVLVI